MFLISLLSQHVVISEKSYYELLGVTSTADSREIRKAFKKLAITMHPDKNPDDPEAQEKFLQLKQAYEILKDQETRKQYDLNGENGVKDGFKSSKDYQTWNFYKDHFGIYDDDPEIITLSSADFGTVISFQFVTITFIFLNNCYLLFRAKCQEFHRILVCEILFTHVFPLSHHGS